MSTLLDINDMHCVLGNIGIIYNSHLSITLLLIPPIASRLE